MSEHISKQFDRELEHIRTRVLQMGGLVETQLLNAVDSFVNRNPELVQQILDGDNEVDAYEVGIAEDCTLLIAREQPAAGDLRLVMAISRIVTDLERVGDKATKIANMARRLQANGIQRIPRMPDLHQCGRLATEMLQRALDALARLDGEAAQKVIHEDKTIDMAFNAILRQLITYMMEDPRTITEALDIIWIAKAIERVGDHAANIAENVIYVVSGVDVRHTAPRKTDAV